MHVVAATTGVVLVSVAALALDAAQRRNDRLDLTARAAEDSSAAQADSRDLALA